MSDLNFDPDFEMSEEELWERFTTYIKMAYSLEGLNRQREAAEVAHQAVAHLPDTDLSERAEMLRDESRIWYHAENYERSIKCSESALRQPDPETNNHKIGIDYFNIGMGNQMLEHCLRQSRIFAKLASFFKKIETRSVWRIAM
jgi:tetratricopeptide (TPR) repeat protein